MNMANPFDKLEQPEIPEDELPQSWLNIRQPQPAQSGSPLMDLLRMRAGAAKGAKDTEVAGAAGKAGGGMEAASL